MGGRGKVSADISIMKVEKKVFKKCVTDLPPEEDLHFQKFDLFKGV